jgi:predicted transcriptional regulator
MELREIARRLDLECLTPELAAELGAEIERGHCTDLLSDVLARADPGGLLVTIQAHLNVIAVAVHARQAAVLLSGEQRPDDEVVRKAVEEKVPVFLSPRSTFDLVGELHALGVRGAF